jgi:hypothetical protein
MDAESIARHKKAFLDVMPAVAGYCSSFASINKRWGAAITAGMIEAGRMDQEAATLFNPLIQDMASTKEKFRLIQDRLVNAILYEMVKKAVLELSDAAKFAINILKRNLYERTADVGYLATDSDLLAFLNTGSDDMDQDGAAERIVARLREYQKEYTVYDEIIVLDLEGRVRAHLDEASPIRVSRDALITQTLAVNPLGAGDKYLETFRPTDLRPTKSNALIYSQSILNANDMRPLGVLCLCFDFEDELRRIFQDLAQGSGGVSVAILDEHGCVIASADPKVLPVGQVLPLAVHEDFSIVSVDGREYLATTQATDGYQGFYGLTWYGMALVELAHAFAMGGEQTGLRDDVLRNLEHVSPELDSIQRESDDILADMTLDSLNGQVKAAKFQADGFVEVLRFVNTIGREIGHMFNESIAGLQATIISSLSNGVQFRAFQANNIADRNLYERANDVCWWALTPHFRETLANLPPGGLCVEERDALREDLQYINDLYTPYLRLVLADARGKILAVSDPPAGLSERLLTSGVPKGQEFVGAQLEPDLFQRALRLGSAADYAVSAFEPTPLYGERPTYIYATAVRAPENAGRVVGVLEIVFDAEPQFAAMLQDVLPRDESKRPIPGSFAAFADRSGHIVSSTCPKHAPGHTLELPPAFAELDCSARTWDLITVGGRAHLAGCQVSAGYREYKVSDGYQNEMLCLVFVPL